MSSDNIFIWNIKKNNDLERDRPERELRIPAPQQKDFPKDNNSDNDSANKDNSIVEDFIIDFNI